MNSVSDEIFEWYPKSIGTQEFKIQIWGRQTFTKDSLVFHTSSIQSRVSARQMVTKSGKLCVLSGAPSLDGFLESGFSEGVAARCADGFPDNWLQLLEQDFLRNARSPPVRSRSPQRQSQPTPAPYSAPRSSARPQAPRASPMASYSVDETRETDDEDYYRSPAPSRLSELMKRPLATEPKARRESSSGSYAYGQGHIQSSYSQDHRARQSPAPANRREGHPEISRGSSDDQHGTTRSGRKVQKPVEFWHQTKEYTDDGTVIIRSSSGQFADSRNPTPKSSLLKSSARTSLSSPPRRLTFNDGEEDYETPPAPSRFSTQPRVPVPNAPGGQPLRETDASGTPLPRRAAPVVDLITPTMEDDDEEDDGVVGPLDDDAEIELETEPTNPDEADDDAGPPAPVDDRFYVEEREVDADVENEREPAHAEDAADLENRPEPEAEEEAEGDEAGPYEDEEGPEAPDIAAPHDEAEAEGNQEEDEFGHEDSEAAAEYEEAAEEEGEEEDADPPTPGEDDEDETAPEPPQDVMELDDLGSHHEDDGLALTSAHSSPTPARRSLTKPSRPSRARRVRSEDEYEDAPEEDADVAVRSRTSAEEEPKPPEVPIAPRTRGSRPEAPGAKPLASTRRGRSAPRRKADDEEIEAEEDGHDGAGDETTFEPSSRRSASRGKPTEAMSPRAPVSRSLSAPRSRTSKTQDVPLRSPPRTRVEPSLPESSPTAPTRRVTRSQEPVAATPPSVPKKRPEPRVRAPIAPGEKPPAGKPKPKRSSSPPPTPTAPAPTRSSRQRPESLPAARDEAPVPPRRSRAPQEVASESRPTTAPVPTKDKAADASIRTSAPSRSRHAKRPPSASSSAPPLLTEVSSRPTRRGLEPAGAPSASTSSLRSRSLPRAKQTPASTEFPAADEPRPSRSKPAPAATTTVDSSATRNRSRSVPTPAASTVTPATSTRRRFEAGWTAEIDHVFNDVLKTIQVYTRYAVFWDACAKEVNARLGSKLVTADSCQAHWRLSRPYAVPAPDFIYAAVRRANRNGLDLDSEPFKRAKIEGRVEATPEVPAVSFGTGDRTQAAASRKRTEKRKRPIPSSRSTRREDDDVSGDEEMSEYADSPAPKRAKVSSPAKDVSTESPSAARPSKAPKRGAAAPSASVEPPVSVQYLPNGVALPIVLTAEEKAAISEKLLLANRKSEDTPRGALLAKLASHAFRDFERKRLERAVYKVSVGRHKGDFWTNVSILFALRPIEEAKAFFRDAHPHWKIGQPFEQLFMDKDPDWSLLDPKLPLDQPPPEPEPIAVSLAARLTGARDQPTRRTKPTTSATTATAPTPAPLPTAVVIAPRFGGRNAEPEKVEVTDGRPQRERKRGTMYLEDDFIVSSNGSGIRFADLQLRPSHAPSGRESLGRETRKRRRVSDASSVDTDGVEDPRPAKRRAATMALEAWTSTAFSFLERAMRQIVRDVPSDEFWGKVAQYVESGLHKTIPPATCRSRWLQYYPEWDDAADLNEEGRTRYIDEYRRSKQQPKAPKKTELSKPTLGVKKVVPPSMTRSKLTSSGTTPAPPAASSSASVEDAIWTSEDLAALKLAHRTISPEVPGGFWEAIAARVGGNHSPADCCNRWNLRFESTRAQPARAASAPAPESPLTADSKMKTQKDRRKLRRALEAEDHEDDAFESSPFRRQKRKRTTIQSGSEEGADAEDDGEGTQSGEAAEGAQDETVADPAARGDDAMDVDIAPSPASPARLPRHPVIPEPETPARPPAPLGPSSRAVPETPGGGVDEYISEIRGINRDSMDSLITRLLPLAKKAKPTVQAPEARLAAAAPAKKSQQTPLEAIALIQSLENAKDKQAERNALALDSDEEIPDHFDFADAEEEFQF